MRKIINIAILAAIVATMPFMFQSCKPKNAGSAVSADAAGKVYVAPGKYDEFYNFVSGGFSGQMSVYGLPSGRLLKVVPIFSVDPEKGWGYSEETKPMLETSHGFIPWDDQHHLDLSQTNGEVDGRWIFANANNTPRVARVDLKTFKTVEIIELPNSAGNHSSPFITENTEYVVAGTRFSVPADEQNGDVPISSYKENFQGSLSFISVNKDNGAMDLAFQLRAPGVNYDLSHSGKGKSHDWFFFTCYNSEQANTLLEINASQKDKYVHNVYDDGTHSATSEMKNEVTVLDIRELKDAGLAYFMPCPKSPHGCDVDPSGEYIVGSGKLATVIPVFSFDKMIKAINDKAYDGEFDGVPVLKYDAVLHGEVQKPGLGPLHTEFDGQGRAITSFFVSSELVRWNLKDLSIVDRVPTYYSVGHLCIPGGDTKKPYGKYVIAYNKITKDRYLPTRPELTQSAQLYDITGDKMQLLLDFPTIGEPHYAQACPAELISKNSKKMYPIGENKNPYYTAGEPAAKVVRQGNKVHVYMTAIRSHFAPDNIEGVKIGDEVYFHVTNLEQDWDVPHGFAVKGAKTAELLVMPGETSTLKWVPERVGIVPIYCTDFCSALHQEMQGYVRVSPAGSNVPLKWGVGASAPAGSPTGTAADSGAAPKADTTKK